LMPFGEVTERLIRAWLSEYHPDGGNIWGLTQSGIVSFLRRLEKRSGIKCNAHTFRRGFASILLKDGINLIDIMRWVTGSRYQWFSSILSRWGSKTQ
jgi:integrase